MADGLGTLGYLRQTFGSEFDNRVQGTRGNIMQQYLSSGSEAAAGIGGSAGAALRARRMAEGATAGEMAANDMFATQQNLDLQAQQLRLAAQQERARQSEFGQELGQRESEFGRSLALDRARLGETSRQFNQSLRQQESEFGRSFGENQRQYDLGLSDRERERQYGLISDYLSNLTAGEYELPAYQDLFNLLRGGNITPDNSGGGSRSSSGGSGGSGAGGGGGSPRPSPDRKPTNRPHPSRGDWAWNGTGWEWDASLPAPRLDPRTTPALGGGGGPIYSS